jgi:hypothetical protein
VSAPAPASLRRTFFKNHNSGYVYDEPEQLAEALKEVEIHRRFECPHYDQCLTHAGNRCWHNFTCTKCPRYDDPTAPVEATEGDQERVGRCHLHLL